MEKKSLCSHVNFICDPLDSKFTTKNFEINLAKKRFECVICTINENEENIHCVYINPYTAVIYCFQCNLEVHDFERYDLKENEYNKFKNPKLIRGIFLQEKELKEKEEEEEEEKNPTVFHRNAFNRRLSSQIIFPKKKDINVYLIKKPYEESCTLYLHYCIKTLQRNKPKLYLDSPAIQDLEAFCKSRKIDDLDFDQFIIFDLEKHENMIDFIITLGGDGTILWASNLFQKRSVPPILGFYKGTLGFMCNYEVLEIDEVVTKIFFDYMNDRKLFVENKMRLCGKIKLENKTIDFHSLNEIIIDRGHSPYFIILNVYLGDKKFTVTSGDGVIFATPTGSTAYALSAGGPIVHNSVSSILMVPISAQSLSFRPILIPTNVEIIVEVDKVCKIDEVSISADGRKKHFLKKGEQLRISQSEFGATLIIENYKNTFDLWIQKCKKLLNWNRDFQR